MHQKTKSDRILTVKPFFFTMSSKQTLVGVGAVILVLLIGGYLYFSKPVKAPSQPVVSTSSTQETTPTEGNQSRYVIDSAASKASFTLQEDLRGTRITVLGTTNQVTGEVVADRNDLSMSKIGTIRINARTLKTDSQQRDGAIARMILKSENDANEFIEFKPKTVSGLPAKGELNQPFTFEVMGDLTISGVTKEATFKGTGQFVSDTELTGSAESKVHYADYNLSVPNLPFLANVEQDVTLKIEFSAKK